MNDLLAEKLKTIQDAAHSEDATKRQWVGDVQKLFNAVQQDWLRDEYAEKKLKFTDQHVQITDGDLGTYWMTQLAIQLDPGPLFLLIPRGMNIVGAVGVRSAHGLRGRVDLVNFADRRSVALYRRADGTWMLPASTSPAGENLDKDSFRRELAKLL